MSDHVFGLGKEVLKKIEDANYQAYFVGGCVRDLLLNRDIGDIDIATSATPDQIIELFEHVIPIGIEHGTVLVRYKNHSFEVTTFRVDGTYSDKRHPDTVQYIDQIDEDLKRRDFTINALAMDYNDNIIDLFGGEQDLHHRMIRTVGNSYDRFKEDPLRMIRALRFSSQLGFEIHENTLEEITQIRKDIEQIAIERITTEIAKLFAGNYVQLGIENLVKTKIYHHLPIFNEQPNLICKLPKKMIPLDSFGEVVALFHFLNPNLSVENWIKQWKGSNKLKREANEFVKALHYYKSNGADQYLVYQLPNDLFEGFTRICKLLFVKHVTNKHLNQLKNNLPIQSAKDLHISGEDLIEMFPHVKQGPWIKELLDNVTKQVILCSLENNKEKLKEWVRCNPPK